MKTKSIKKLFFISLFSIIAIILSANVSLAYMDYSDYPPNFWSYSFTIIHDYDGELEYADDEVMRPLEIPYDLSSKVRPRDGYEVSGYDPAAKVTEGTIKDTLTIRYKKKAAPPPPPPPQNNDNNNNPPPQNGGKKDSYIYIYYRSVGGHDVLASQTIQGSDGETLNLNDYVKDVTTMTHVGFNPSSATLTFDKKRRGMGVILYEKNQKLNKDNNNNNQGNNNGYNNNQGNNSYNNQNNNYYNNYNNPNNNQYNNDNNQYNYNNNQNNNGYTNNGKKDSYIYIYYRSVAGHDVLASQTVQGSDGETLNLNDYVKDVTTMTHVGFNPSSATLTFNKKKRGMGVILYEKNQKLNKQGSLNTGNKIGSQIGNIGNTGINTQNNNVIISSPKLKHGNVRYVKSTNGYVYPNKILTRAELAGYIGEIINESYWDNVEFTIEDFNVVDVVGNTTNIEGIVASYLTGTMPAKQGLLFKPNDPVTKGDLAIAVANLVDISKNSHSQAEAIKFVTSKKIMSVEKNGNFMPNKTLTRGQVIVVLNKLVGNKNSATKNVQLNDVNAKAWYYKDIQAAVQ
ncbi:SLH domain protein [Peptostreptococcaceae bacterium AS15]|nr:SLH domain protein [Peptostreptococcaceae bacterium AS15]